MTAVYADLANSNKERTNEYLFIKDVPSEKDYDPLTVQDSKIWKKIGSVYKCGNCGYIPTFISKIREWKRCPKCEILKFYYETDKGLDPMFDFTEGVENKGDGQSPMVPK